MRSSINFDNKLIMVSQMKNDSTFQMLEYDRLKGIGDYNIASTINNINESGARLKQVRIILEDSSVKVEPGAISYIRGNIELINNRNKALSLGKKIISNKFSNEVIEDKPVYGGEGEIFLEPSFQHYAFIELEDEEIIIDDGLFLACEEGVDVKTVINGRKYEIVLSGEGIVVIELPVPADEVFKCKINNDTLMVDGDFVLLRGGNIDHTVEQSALVSGNGLLNVYSGIGDIWLVPTQPIYKSIVDNNSTNNYPEEDY